MKPIATKTLDWKKVQLGQFYQYQEGNEIKMLVIILEKKRSKENYEFVVQVEEIIDGIDTDSYRVGQKITVSKPKEGKIIGTAPEFRYLGDALD